MAEVTLAEAKNNTQEDYDAAVIDEFRKESAILDALTFDQAVNPAGGGATLTYGYRRLVTEPTAQTRALNTEYATDEVTTSKHSVDLAVLGGAFSVDRVIASLGAQASGSVALNMAQKIKAARTKFQDEVINGDIGVDANGFDGLDKALTGSTTEFRADEVTEWGPTAFGTTEGVHGALDALDEWLSLLDAAPTIILGNQKALARVRAAARRAGMYVQNPVEGLLGPAGRPIVRETYGNITFVDPGEKAGSNTPIIPVETRTVNAVSEDGLTDLYAVRIGLDGFHGVTTVGSNIVRSWMPDFSGAGAVKKGEVELGPVSVALKATKAASVFRNIRVADAA